jgi:cell division protein YceG involved in septum cleavage
MNSKERTQAYLKFLLFFVITVLVVVLAIYIDFYTPSRENKLLKEEVDLQRRQEANQQKFIDKMTRAITLLDSLNSSKNNTDQLRLQIGAQIDDLRKLQENAGGLYDDLDKAVIESMSALIERKVTITGLEGSIQKYKDDLETCKSQGQQFQSQSQLAIPRN